MNLAKLNLDSWSKNFLILAVAATIPQIGLLLYALPQLPPVVPLFYSLPWSEARLTDPILLWLLPALSGAVILVNLIGSHLLNEVVLTRILNGTGFLFALFALVTLAKIVLLGLP